MYSAAYVDEAVKKWKELGMTASEIVFCLCDACMGWPYIWGARGHYCTPSVRKSFANRSSTPAAESKVIRSKCQVCSGKKGGCAGCKWYPSAKVRSFDCRGFTYWIFKQIGIVINGAGATSQWNNNDNWAQKGDIKDLPPKAICCVFMKNGKKMSHTGVHVGGGLIIHCSGEVKQGKTTDKGWTHYAIPKGMEGESPMPVPVIETRPTLRNGSSGKYVTECQNDLLQLGYDLSPYGADGKYGKKTTEAVAKFQTVHGLTPDGICGKLTWAALDEALKAEPEPEPTIKYYTAHIPHQTAEQVAELKKTFPDSWSTEE